MLANFCAARARMKIQLQLVYAALRVVRFYDGKRAVFLRPGQTVLLPRAKMLCLHT